jgi:hypothetical protein
MNEFVLTSFYPKFHMEHLSNWMAARDMAPVDASSLPSTGAVVGRDKEHPIAIGFLMRTDTPVAVLCNFVADPNVDKDVRGRAVDKLFETLEAQARHLGYTHVSAMSSIHKMVSRFEKMEYKNIEDNLSHYMGVL